MKLNISAKELLALHNLLHSKFEYEGPSKLYSEDDPRASADVALEQVYARTKSIILGALQGKHPDELDRFDAWAAKEQSKIDHLSDKLVDVKDEERKLRDDVVTLGDFPDDKDVLVPDYPRRGNRGGNRGGRGGNKR